MNWEETIAYRIVHEPWKVPEEEYFEYFYLILCKVSFPTKDDRANLKHMFDMGRNYQQKIDNNAQR